MLKEAITNSELGFDFTEQQLSWAVKTVCLEMDEYILGTEKEKLTPIDIYFDGLTGGHVLVDIGSEGMVLNCEYLEFEKEKSEEMFKGLKTAIFVELSIQKSRLSNVNKKEKGGCMVVFLIGIAALALMSFILI